MKFECNGLDLSEAFNKVTRAIPTKKIDLKYEGVKVSAYGSTVTLYATDRDFSIQTKIHAQVYIEGEVLVPGKLVCDIVRKLSTESKIEINYVDNHKLSIVYNDNTIDVAVMSLDDYMDTDDEVYEDVFTIKEGDFKDAVKKTWFASLSPIGMSTKESYRDGCNIVYSNNTFECVASDGYRLSYIKKDINYNGVEKNFILRKRNIYEIAGIMENDENDVTIYVKQDKKVKFEFDAMVITSSVINQKFIEYRSIINSNSDIEIMIEKNQLIDCLERGMIISRINGFYPLKFDLKEGKLRVYNENDIGYFSETIPVFSKGKDTNLCINAKYVLECLKVIDNKFIKLTLSKNIAVLITSADEEEKSDFVFMILVIK